MIQLSRPPKPQKLSDNEEKLSADYEADRTKSVWNKKYIREALLEMSHNKCCYCECKIGRGEREMHVDHFKPKSIYPELVVAWENLFPACPHCNKEKSDHDSGEYSIINPVDDNPKDYFYLRDYRYCCFDNTDNSKARRTLGVLSLNDSTENVIKRYQIGNELHDKIDQIADLAIENKASLKENIRIRNKVKNGCRDIMKLGFPDATYSAFMATLVFNDEDFITCVEILKQNELWDDDLEKGFKTLKSNVFQTSKKRNDERVNEEMRIG